MAGLNRNLDNEDATCAFVDDVDNTKKVLFDVSSVTTATTRTVSWPDKNFTPNDGDVVGPASSTDNAITRFDSTTGKLLKNTTTTLNDTGTFGTGGAHDITINPGNNNINLTPDSNGRIFITAGSTAAAGNSIDLNSPLGGIEITANNTTNGFVAINSGISSLAAIAMSATSGGILISAQPDTNTYQFILRQLVTTGIAAADFEIHSNCTNGAGTGGKILINTTAVSGTPGKIEINSASTAADSVKIVSSGDIDISGGNIRAATALFGVFGSSQGQPAAYTPTNVVTDRSYDANSTTLAELADVLGTLIADLQGYGLLQ